MFFLDFSSTVYRLSLGFVFYHVFLVCIMCLLLYVYRPSVWNKPDNADDDADDDDDDDDDVTVTLLELGLTWYVAL